MNERGLRAVICILAQICVFIAFACTEIENQKYETTTAKLTQQINDLRDENVLLSRQLSEAEAMIQAQKYLIDELKQSQDKPKKEEKADRGGEREPQLTSLGTYTVTAYCSCEKCCGEYAKNRPGGKVYGAAGVELTPGISVAGWLPLGTQIMIDGHEYIVQDRTAKWVKDKYDSRIIDIYFEDHEAAWDWGKRSLEVCKID